MAYQITITDQKDGSGISATVVGTDPAATNTLQVSDSTQPGTWRDVASRTGDGRIFGTVGEGLNQVTLSRTYLARVNTLTGIVLNIGSSVVLTATRGLKSYAFEEILQAKHALVAANISEVGGNIFACIDPRVTKALPDLPAIFLFQASGEPYTPIDNTASFVDLPIACQIADRLEADWCERLEWWLYARQAVIDTLNRYCTEFISVTGSGRRWRIEPGALIVPDDDPSAYLYRASLITLHVDLERPIRGV